MDHLLRGETALTVDAVDVAAKSDEQQRDLHAHTSPPNSRRDYVARRIAYWGIDSNSNGGDSNDNDSRRIDLGAIHSLPRPLQVAFRRKMLAIFVLQLLLVCALVSACAFYAPVRAVVQTLFTVQVTYLVAAAVVLVTLLVLLYVIRALFPLNWLVLLMFSVMQAGLFAALGVRFDTHLGVFNCGATLCCVVIMLLLAGVERSSSSSSSSSPSRSRDALLSTFAAGLIAFVVVALAACALYGSFGRAFVTPEGFAASLAFQFVLVLWFAFDADAMYRVMSPDEYMHGVIYFYTDMVLLVIMSAIAAGVVALFVAMAAMCGGDGSSDCGDCGNCGGCACGDCGGTSGDADSSGCNTVMWSDCYCYWWSSSSSSSGSSCCSCCSRSEKTQQHSSRSNHAQDKDAYQGVDELAWVEPQKNFTIDGVKDLEMQRV